MIILLDLLMGFSIRCPPRAGDDEIAKDIEDKIAAYLDFQDSQVKVSVKGGMVMWTDALLRTAAPWLSVVAATGRFTPLRVFPVTCGSE